MKISPQDSFWLSRPQQNNEPLGGFSRVGSASCASWGTLWSSGRRWPHAHVGTPQTGSGPLGFSEVSARLSQLSHNFPVVSLTEGAHTGAWCSLSGH